MIFHCSRPDFPCFELSSLVLKPLLQADPETVMMSSLYIPALNSASYEGQACAKAAFSVHKVCFTAW